MLESEDANLDNKQILKQNVQRKHLQASRLVAPSIAL